MERFEEAVPLYLKACEVEGKTERTVQSYAETLRQFRAQSTNSNCPTRLEPSGRRMSTCSWAGSATAA